MLLCKNDTVILILLQSRVKLTNCKRFALVLNVHMVILNNVQVKWSWPVAWIFAYRIKTWQARARPGFRHSVTG